MFKWFKKNTKESHSVDWNALNREDEVKDHDYLENFTGEKDGVVFENANCHVKFFYKGITSVGHRIICGKNVIFNGGKIISGDYRCHEWSDGEFNGNTLKCRFFSGGVFNGKHLICEQVKGGVCKSGIVECSSWDEAEFDGDVLACTNWKSGKFAGNIFHGKWRGGTWEGKLFKGIDLSGSGLETQERGNA